MATFVCPLLLFFWPGSCDVDIKTGWLVEITVSTFFSSPLLLCGLMSLLYLSDGFSMGSMILYVSGKMVSRRSNLSVFHLLLWLGLFLNLVRLGSFGSLTTSRARRLF